MKPEKNCRKALFIFSSSGFPSKGALEIDLRAQTAAPPFRKRKPPLTIPPLSRSRTVHAAGGTGLARTSKHVFSGVSHPRSVPSAGCLCCVTMSLRNHGSFNTTRSQRATREEAAASRRSALPGRKFWHYRVSRVASSRSTVSLPLKECPRKFTLRYLRGLSGNDN